MTAKLIDGKAIAEIYRAEYKIRVDRLIERGVKPGLAVIVVGNNAASQVYVRNKVRACEAVGIHSEVLALPNDTLQSELLTAVADLNANPDIHGVLVQMPLPAHLDERPVIEAIHPMKDVDGFHYANMGALVIDTSWFPPCTPFGVMQMLAHEEIEIEGKHAVVIGRSNIVGKPQAMLLVKAGATVTICHSKTKDLAKYTRDADILVVAVGRENIIAGTMIKPGAVVIDVGINRLPSGKLCGDVDFESAKNVAGFITPVPGGVGPMTITMLLGNTLRAAERVAGLAQFAGFTMMA